MTLMQLQLFIIIVIINLWTKGLDVTHTAECSVALELPLSLISNSSNITPSCGDIYIYIYIYIYILFWFLLSFIIFMCCYQHHLQRLPRGWTVRGSNPGGGEIFSTCPEGP